MTTYFAVIKTPIQELKLKVKPARDGVRFQIGERHVYLTGRTARELADALVDAAEQSASTDSGPASAGPPAPKERHQ